MGITTLWNGRAVLGEGPVWDARRGVLWFVDIKGRRVQRLDPAGGEAAAWPAPEQIGWVLPAEGVRLLAGLQSGLALFDPRDGSFEPLAAVEPDLPGNRLNDATVAPDGAVWFGSMDDEETARTGRVYRWNGESVEPVGIDPVRIVNGPAISPDGSTLYHVDTAGGAIRAFDVHEDGRVGAGRDFAHVAPAEGYPDGVCVDAAGNVWVGLWEGWRARLYSPAGSILAEVPIPAAKVTKVALGGDDLRTAFVTTASLDTDVAEQPQAGGVFAFRADIPGQRLPPARLAGPARHG